MTKSTQVVSQNYPRIQDENNPFYGCLDDSTFAPHKHKISLEKLKKLILAAINNANKNPVVKSYPFLLMPNRK
jgi:hypothetical protein